MSDAPPERGSHLPPGGLPEARAALIEWIDDAGPAGRRFLQAHVARVGPGLYRLRHAADAALPPVRLEQHADPFTAREIAQVTDEGEHRPLKTAPNMRRGWSFEALDAAALWTALDYLYPACVAHWYAGRVGTLRVTHWRETAGRQSGIYSAVGLLAEPALRDTVRACCGDAVCLRSVAWGVDGADPAPPATDLESMLGAASPDPGDASVPCPEACSMFVSLARKVLTIERSPRQELPGLGAVGALEAEQIRAVVGAAAAGTLGEIREGEFDEPANPRRVRYLAARLARIAPALPVDALPCDGCPRPVKCAGCPLT